jgi:hypothetical protein
VPLGTCLIYFGDKENRYAKGSQLHSFALTAEELDGVVIALFPQLGVDTPEEVDTLGVPGPIEVMGEYFQIL